MKVCIITGATSGIGEQLKFRFEKDGYFVINISRSCERDEHNYPCDLADYNALKTVFENIFNKIEQVDILINCAGYGIAGATEIISYEEATRIFDVNFFGTLNCCKFVISKMKAGAKIVNISSACAIFPLPYRTLYCASKSAVSMLSECLQMELKPLGIEICNICPGDIKTNFSKNRVKIQNNDNRYKDVVSKNINQIEKREKKRMNLQKATDKIYKIINKSHYRPLYIIGGSYKMLYLISKIFPKRFVNYCIYKKFGG